MSNSTIINKIVEKERIYFNEGHTLPISARIKSLKLLETSIRNHEDLILSALKSDLNKSRYEGYMTELAIVFCELDHTLKNIKHWARPERKKVALSQAPAKAKIIKEPYGTVLIMAPWNYPFQLCMVPLIGAIAAGNTAVVKPSAYAPAVSNAVCSVISEAFPPEYVSVVEGGREENNALLEQHFDYIFFTGSPAVGKTVMQQAANNLTPVTLELGGKSPVIAEQSADIKKTAKRILFGKLLNAGQTCVAPDYLLVQNSIKAELINEIKNHYNTMIPDTKYKRENFPKIINKKHFDRIRQLMETQDILIGGNTYPDTLQIEFTLVNEPDTESSLMQEEIFGPVLPVIGFDDINEAVNFVKSRPKPLALYLFTKDKSVEKTILKNLSFGGGCVNDTVMHLSSPHLPFGGVGNSGMGRYHGKETFETFSHTKSILKKSWYLDIPVRYHPFQSPDKKLPEWLFKK